MARKKKYNHIHRYITFKKYPGLFRCSVAGCTHSINGGPEFILGLQAECPYCEQPYIVKDTEILRRRILHCGLCTKYGDPVETPLVNIEAEPPPQNRIEDNVFAELLQQKGIE